MAAASRGVLEVSLFDRLRLRYDDVPFVLSAPPKTPALLALLLLGGGDSAIPREQLASALWPDELDAVARANLRRHLHYLTRALPAGAPWFDADARTVRSNAARPIAVDVARFEAALAAGRREEAAELYAGDLLSDVDDDWVQRDRARLRAMHADNLTALIALHRAGRRHAAAARYARALLAHDPWSEEALRALMTARFELGERAAALADYAAFASALREDVGAEPMAETQTLRTRIAAAATPAMSEAGDGRRAATIVPFVGRAKELALLRAIARGAVYGDGGLAFVAGEPGIGKSRLLAEFRALVEQDGALFVAGATSAPERGPYEPLLEALGPLARTIADAPLDPVDLAAIAAAVPAVAALRPDTAPPPALGPDEQRARLFDAIATALRAASRRAPLVVGLEDLHWAGASTCSLLAALVDALRADAVTFVATYRDEDVGGAHPLHALLRAEAHRGRHIVLRPFDVDEVARYAAAMTGHAVERERAQALHERSDGNPFVLGELLCDALDREATGSGATGPQPSTDAAALAVDGIIAARFGRVGASARALAETACVMGRRFPLAVVSRAAGLGASRAADAVDELQDQRIVHDLGKGEFAFLHHIIVDALYARTRDDDRVRRHRRVAQALEDLPADGGAVPHRELAHHWELGGDPVRAARYRVDAARAASSVFAYEEAREHVDRALALGADPETTVAALLLREELDRRAGDRSAQENDLAALERALDGRDDADARCELLRRRAVLAHVCGDRVAERTAITALLRNARRLRSARWAAIALLLSATSDITAGRFAPARAAIGRAEARGAGTEPALAVEARCNLAALAVHRAEYETAERTLDEAWRLAGADEMLRYRVLHERHNIARARERFDGVLHLARELLTYSQRVGDRRAEMFNQLRVANAAMFVFDVAEAREHFGIAERMARTLGTPRERATIAHCRGILAYALGDAEDALALFAAAFDIARSADDRFGVVLAEVNVAAAEYAADAHAAAIARAERCVQPARALGAVELEAAAHCTSGAALRSAGDARAGLERLRTGVAMERAAGLRWTLGQDLAELILTQLAAGEHPQAAQSVDELCELARIGYGGLTQTQYILWVASEAAAAGGDEPRAGALRVRATDAFRDRLSRIPDERSRRTFAAAWFNRGLVRDERVLDAL